MVAYPTGDDLATYLAEFGITATNTTLLDVLAAAGVARFEGEIGRVMLAGNSEERTFDPPTDGLLDLGSDLAAAPTVTYTPLGAAPESQVVATDYRLLPENALARGKPIERIEFRRRWWYPYSFDQSAAIGITGLWGYGTTIPDDAWLAMLAAGATALFDQSVLSNTGGGALTSWREGNSAATYAQTSTVDRTALKANFLVSYPGAVANYRKVVMG